ncbi:hypothetical protein SAMN05216339_101342 [Nitrosomonas eutropha]|uniref:Uncharacterized protein n=1 Tax=Nitrosomonas eutropha TaxID=916 RepID=A0A1I7F892_9PROT|nr:hypothetical protein [Nitrosomonas eutropha]SFU32397.1 hypothetical protein SAMN05216339_101342 [Nitrosomonas eutropha]
MTVSTSSSVVSAPPASSSSPGPIGAVPPTPLVGTQGNSEDSWWKKPEALIAMMGMALTGVIGYFSSSWTVKESVSRLSSNVSVLAERVNNLSDRVSEAKSSSASVPSIERDIAVIQVKIEANAKAIEELRQKAK